MKKIIYLSSIDLTSFNGGFWFSFLRTKKLDLEYWYAHFLYSIKKTKRYNQKKIQKIVFFNKRIKNLKKSLNFKLVIVCLLS